MVPSTAGEVVLIKFPFSDLSSSKLRPAVVLADAGRGDWILCQLTSNPYADAHALKKYGFSQRKFAEDKLRTTRKTVYGTSQFTDSVHWHI